MAVYLADCRRETQYSKLKSTKRKLGHEDSTDVLKNTTAEAVSEVCLHFAQF